MFVAPSLEVQVICSLQEGAGVSSYTDSQWISEGMWFRQLCAVCSIEVGSQDWRVSVPHPAAYSIKVSKLNLDVEIHKESDWTSQQNMNYFNDLKQNLFRTSSDIM